MDAPRRAGATTKPDSAITNDSASNAEPTRRVTANRVGWSLSTTGGVTRSGRSSHTVSDSRLASHEAILDAGAHNLVARSTTTGSQYRYDGREVLGRLCETTDGIVRLQSNPREGRLGFQSDSTAVPTTDEAS
jgi:hypothetical protein